MLAPDFSTTNLPSAWVQLSQHSPFFSHAPFSMIFAKKNPPRTRVYRHPPPNIFPSRFARAVPSPSLAVSALELSGDIDAKTAASGDSEDAAAAVCLHPYLRVVHSVSPSVNLTRVASSHCRIAFLLLMATAYSKSPRVRRDLRALLSVRMPFRPGPLRYATPTRDLDLVLTCNGIDGLKMPGEGTHLALKKTRLSSQPESHPIASRPSRPLAVSDLELSGDIDVKTTARGDSEDAGAAVCLHPCMRVVHSVTVSPAERPGHLTAIIDGLHYITVNYVLRLACTSSVRMSFRRGPLRDLDLVSTCNGISGLKLPGEGTRLAATFRTARARASPGCPSATFASFPSLYSFHSESLRTSPSLALSALELSGDIDAKTTASGTRRTRHLLYAYTHACVSFTPCLRR
ncbi:hypothetical protein B0H11DRAFT_2223064 [Mycena galericulata]|nr:hypothetical protein B0H11DRAFT_2223064 [Mycena galericulata]